MNVIHNAADLPDVPRKVCLAIGVFDGVHLGHQQVIRQAITDASHQEAHSIVVTFDPHPSAIVAPQAVPKSIYSSDQKQEEFRALGVDTTLIIPFDCKFSQLPAEDFIRDLGQSFGEIRSICVGRDFTFGHKRSGNIDVLNSLGDTLQFTVHGLAAVSLDDEVISSTRIRQMIASGRLDYASQMLGRDYKISGRIVHGDGIGRKLGFPTANIDVTGVQTPPNGVYAVHVFHNGTRLRGVANVGVRPTIEGIEPELRLEVHLLNFDQTLYNERIDVQFLEFIRSEMKFASVEELKIQIAKDVSTASDRF